MEIMLLGERIKAKDMYNGRKWSFKESKWNVDSERSNVRCFKHGKILYVENETNHKVLRMVYALAAYIEMRECSYF